MQIIEIVASLANKAAGPSYSVPRLASAVARAGATVNLVSLGSGSAVTRDLVLWNSFAHSYSKVPLVRDLRLSTEMRAHLLAAAEGADVLHAHGLWLMTSIYPAIAARRAGKAFVLSPRGMLGGAALEFSSGKKKAFWAMFQKRAARFAAMLHATSDAEYAEIRAMGLVNPVTIIPNGIDLGPDPQAGHRAKVVLSLGRIHPKKGLERLVLAWAHAGHRVDGWKLRIVGPNEMAYADRLRALARSLGLANIAIEGPLFDGEKRAAFQEASLFVLPTLNDNFALSVAEALAAEVPVVCTKGAPWSGLLTRNCGWWVDHGVEALAAALSDAVARPPGVLLAMGKSGRDWMRREYSWDRIGQEMLLAYRWAAGRGERPMTVRV